MFGWILSVSPVLTTVRRRRLSSVRLLADLANYEAAGAKAGNGGFFFSCYLGSYFNSNFASTNPAQVPRPMSGELPLLSLSSGLHSSQDGSDNVVVGRHLEPNLRRRQDHAAGHLRVVEVPLHRPAGVGKGLRLDHHRQAPRARLAAKDRRTQLLAGRGGDGRGEGWGGRADGAVVHVSL